MCGGTDRPSIKAVFSNWRSSDASTGEKIKMAVKNNMIKIKTRRNCCGNHGEVGC